MPLSSPSSSTSVSDPTTSATPASSTPAPSAATPTPTTGVNGIYGLPFDKQPATETHEAAALAATTSATDYALIEKVFSASPAKWLTHSTSDVQAAVSRRVTNAASRGGIATLVAYNIPNIGCKDTGETAVAYRQWIDQFVAGLGANRAIVIVEPDALAHIDCLTASQQTERLSLVHYAASTIAHQGSWVYLDAGHSSWVKVATIAARLNSAGISEATGFSLNVSNFRSNAETIPYGQAISALVGNKHFVIDTSRNGVNPDSTEWCNPPNRGLGLQPTTHTAASEVDAYLWVKPPGQSDGSCNGGIAGGTWLQDYALMLARNAAF